MKDQHEKITGYRDLSQGEINAMNVIKAKCAEVGQLIRDLDQPEVVGFHVDPRWLAIARTELQKGFMFLTRAVAKPSDGF